MSTYYSDPKISRREKEEREADIRGKIEQIRVEQPRTGYRPLLAELKKSGVVIGERRLRRIMKKFSLHIKPRRRFVRTTQSDHDHPVHENLIKGMEVTKINQLWVSDITYIRITNGFVYLAVVMDIYSRKVVGWAISKKIDRHLTLAALQMAIKQRAPKEGIIHHSDRGVQYLCDDYVKLLVDSGFQVSCSRKGNPYDNAFAESFMKTLKDNEVHLWSYETILDVLERVPYFIEEVYNKKRLHSALDYQSPEEFENEIKVRYKNKKSASRYVVKIGGSTP
nr:IS3 family transposase [Bdellovibrio sp. HM001]BFD64541.1 IS3 family transposase [Bdellovibrio sp. HM001]BFD64544.1 IS3 family transposase [Bdellovibrio sp. HM001]BFD64551.1 IS3 family transposase [Bdellovibrio sp. HM001]